MLDSQVHELRGRLHAETAARMVADMGDKAARLTLDLATEREVTAYLVAQTTNLERCCAVAGEAEAAAKAETAQHIQINAALLKELTAIRDALGMVVWEGDAGPFLAKIRQQGVDDEAARWGTAIGLSDPATAKLYIAKLERELEEAAAPAAPAGGGGGGQGVTVTMQPVAPLDPDKVAAAVAEAAKPDAGKRRATPRRERVTIAEVCAIVAEVRSRSLGPDSMSKLLPEALIPLIGKVVVGTPKAETGAELAAAQVADHDPEVLVVAPGQTVAEARAAWLASVGVAVRWVPTEYGHRLEAKLPERAGRTPDTFNLATVKHLFPPGTQEGDHDVETMFDELFQSPGSADSHAPHADAEHHVRRTLCRLVAALEDPLPVPPPLPRSPAA